MTRRSKVAVKARKRLAAKVLGRSAATGGVIYAPKTKPKSMTVEEIARVVSDMLTPETSDATAAQPIEHMPGRVRVAEVLRRNRQRISAAAEDKILP